MRIHLTSILYLLVLSDVLFGQADPNALATHLDELRSFDAAKRAALRDSKEFQNNAAYYREVEKAVFTPLLTGDLNAYAPVLLTGLTDPDPYIKRYTMYLITVASMNPESKLLPESARVKALARLVPPLIVLTDEAENEDVRSMAVGTLARLISTKHPAIPTALKKAREDKNAKVRNAGLLGLALAPQEQATAVEESLNMLHSDSEAVNRRLAAVILGEYKGNEPRIVPALLAALNDPSAEVQQAAVVALERKANPGNGVRQALKTKLAEPNLNPSVRVQIERSADIQRH